MTQEDDYTLFLMSIGFSRQFLQLSESLDELLYYLSPMREKGAVGKMCRDFFIRGKLGRGRRTHLAAYSIGSADEEVRYLSGAAQFLDLQELVRSICGEQGSGKDPMLNAGEGKPGFATMPTDGLRALATSRYKIALLNICGLFAVEIAGNRYGPFCQISDFFCVGKPEDVERALGLFYEFLSSSKWVEQE